MHAFDISAVLLVLKSVSVRFVVIANNVLVLGSLVTSVFVQFFVTGRSAFELSCSVALSQGDWILIKGNLALIDISESLVSHRLFCHDPCILVAIRLLADFSDRGGECAALLLKLVGHRSLIF